MKVRIVLCAISLLSILWLCSCDRPYSVPSSKADLPLLTFERSGEAAGFRERLVIGYHGEYYWKHSGEQERIGLLGPDRRAQLQDWAERFAPFTMTLEENPDMPDNLIRQLAWTGLGKVAPSQTQQRDILNWANELVEELSTRH